jgi:hypothetical protein
LSGRYANFEQSVGGQTTEVVLALGISYGRRNVNARRLSRLAELVVEKDSNASDAVLVGILDAVAIGVSPHSVSNFQLAAGELFQGAEAVQLSEQAEAACWSVGELSLCASRS